MSILTIILVVISSLLLLILIVAAIAPKEMRVEQSVIINKPKQQVFDYVRLLKNQDNFNKNRELGEPDMKKEYRGTDGQEGFVYSWSSKKAGAGEQEIKKITGNDSIEVEMRFERPLKLISQVKMNLEALSATETKVTWGFCFPTKIPLNTLTLVMKKHMLKDMNESLNNLKQILEK